MIICVCEGVTDRDVEEAVTSGSSTLAEIQDNCHAGGDCGTCRLALQEMIDAMQVRRDTRKETADLAS